MAAEAETAAVEAVELLAAGRGADPSLMTGP
jgi:hypothetical protein